MSVAKFTLLREPELREPTLQRLASRLYECIHSTMRSGGLRVLCAMLAVAWCLCWRPCVRRA
eukprot:scaffold268969_cov32-Tisochrysis_lutea.AAC.4